MINGKTLITMDRRNVVFSVVQDRSKIQTFTPTLFKMSTQQQQQTAEKSVQTQDLAGPATLLVTNNPVGHLHTENTATEVANTLVSMATGRQRGTIVKQLNVISVPSTQTTLPILSLADYTTSRGVPTAMALANQAKLTPTKHEEMLDDDDDDDEDDVSMSTDEYNQTRNDSKSRTKSTRGKFNKTMSKHNKHQTIEPIQYGPILVKPRKNIAPTLANGRKSKDEPLPPEEDVRRKQRRDRNKQAAAKCRRKRNDLREELEKVEQLLVDEQKSLEHSVQTLADKKNQLENLLHRHACTKTRLPITTTTANTLNISKTDLRSISTTALLDSNNNNGNNKRVTINFTNAQDLLAIAPLTRITTSDGSSSSSSVPMITIHIIPEVAQALLGSTSVDKAKLAELLQQAGMNNSSSTITISDSANTNTSTNSTS